jgi:hypothetical protein
MNDGVRVIQSLEAAPGKAAALDLVWHRDVPTDKIKLSIAGF